jgi:hypothetical protein
MRLMAFTRREEHHGFMSSAPVAPSREIVVWSARSFALAATTVGFIGAGTGWLGASLLIPAVMGRSPDPDWLSGIVFVAFFTFCSTVFPVVTARRRPSRLVFGADVLELAAPGKDTVTVAYEAVSSARVRWFWPVAVLEVCVGGGDRDSRGTSGSGEGNRPIRTRQGGRYLLPLAGMGSAATIRCHLQRHGLRR